MPLSRYQYAQRLAKIVAVLAQEPPDDRGWTSVRIAEITGLSKASVTAHIRRHRLSPLQHLKSAARTDAGWRAGRAPQWRYLDRQAGRRPRDGKL